MLPTNHDPLRDFVARYVPFLAEVPFLASVLVAVAVLMAGWAASRWLRRLARRAFASRKLDPALASSLATLIRVAVLTTALIVALDAIGFKTTSLLTIVASAGLAVGLALQGTLTNLASGVLLLVFRPFTVGHEVSIAGNIGVVKEIGLFFTTLVTQEKKTVVIQNSAVTGATMINFSAEGVLRGWVDVGVPGDRDVGQTAALLLKAIKGADRVRPEPAPEVVFNGLASNSLQFTVSVWGPVSDFVPMLEAVQRALLTELREGGIDIANAKIAPRAL